MNLEKEVNSTISEYNKKIFAAKIAKVSLVDSVFKIIDEYKENREKYEKVSDFQLIYDKVEEITKSNIDDLDYIKEINSDKEKEDIIKEKDKDKNSESDSEPDHDIIKIDGHRFFILERKTGDPHFHEYLIVYQKDKDNLISVMYSRSKKIIHIQKDLLEFIEIFKKHPEFFDRKMILNEKEKKFIYKHRYDS